MCRRLNFKPIFPRLPNEVLWERGGSGRGEGRGLGALLKGANTGVVKHQARKKTLEQKKEQEFLVSD